MSHITGGGFIENVPRVLPEGLGCYIDARTWELPAEFLWLMREGGVEPLEMARTFNCGIGMVVVVGKEDAEEVKKRLRGHTGKSQAEVWNIGEVVEGKGVEMRGLDSWKKP